MKKHQKKRKERPEKKLTVGEQNLADLGLEPPKIYRNNTTYPYSREKDNTNKERRLSQSKGSQNLTRAEKRQRDNKKRKKRNTVRKIIIWLLVIVVLVSAATVLSLTVFFHIDTINVSGNTVYTKDEVLAQCTIDKGENLFLSDTDTAERMLEQNLPYIYNAQITRKLPYTIQIKITEATPAYSIKNKDKTYILLDDNFKVLENAAKKPQGITISKADTVSSEPGTQIKFKDENIGECLSKLASCVKANSFDEITAIYSKGLNDNYVVYDKRITFKLGSCSNLDDKIYQCLTACEKLNESNPNASGTMTITGGKSLYFTED